MSIDWSTWPLRKDFVPVECLLPVALWPVPYQCTGCGKPKENHEVARHAAGVAVCWDCGGYELLAVLEKAAREVVSAANLGPVIDADYR